MFLLKPLRVLAAFLLLFLAGSSALAQKSILVYISNDSLLLPQPRAFYIDRVVDLRTDTTLIGSSGNSKRLEFPGSSTQVFNRFLQTAVKPRPGQHPVILQILALRIDEKIIGNYNLKGRIKVRFLSPDSASMVSLGEYEEEVTMKGENAVLVRSETVRKCFQKVLEDLSLRGLAGGESLAGQNAGIDFQPDYPWPWYRASYPDSLPDGLYDNVANFRNGKPMRQPPQYHSYLETEDGVQRMELVYADGPHEDRKIREGKFFVHKGTVYARSAEVFVPLIRHKNGFYILGKKGDVLSNAAGRTAAIVAAGIGTGFIGAMIVASTVPTTRTSRIQYLTKFILDMRTGKAVPETDWEKHLENYQNRKPGYLILYSRSKNLPRTKMYLVSEGDTAIYTLEGRTKLKITLKNDFEMHSIVDGIRTPIEFMAKPGLYYIKADLTKFENMNAEIGEFESKYLEAPKD